MALVHLVHLSLHNFRNYVRLELDLPPSVVVLLGDNAQGKTNLLEAIYYLATSRSPYTSTDRELINWLSLDQEPLPYTRLAGRVARGDNSVLLEITVSQQAENGSRYQKQVRLNGVNKRAMDLLGHLNVVLFVPEDVNLVSGSPSLRRRYLDVMLCQIDSHYCRTLAGYNQIVTQRNALLRDMRERGGDPVQLAFWNERLVEHGAHLINRRREAIGALDALAQAIHGQLTDGSERLHLHYAPSVDLGEGHLAIAEIQAAYQAQLQSLRQREMAAGMTLAGPHRDEMRFSIDDIDAGVYGSRGQQRTAVLALKLAEVEMMHHETGDYPVLLLDDVLSELDAHRRRFLLQRVDDGQQQAIITTTELQALPPAFLQGCRLWHVEMGRLAEVS
jgi:DNA replication and repair protein RecF